MDEGDSDGGKTSEKKPVVVILVGAPGSGKSTFCDEVMKVATERPWVRICQDIIANGKAGTKLQCLRNTTDALSDGKSVLIDRCNLDREQRAEFVKLGSNIDVHSVILDLPARVCISRCIKRSGHEGNLQGGKAASVVNRMLQKKELPKLTEGFSRITFCKNKSDVQEAVRIYQNLGPSDSLPSGCFGQNSADSKVQLGIMKFMKKIDSSSNVSSHEGLLKDPVTKQATMDNIPCDTKSVSENGNKIKFVGSKDPKDCISSNGVHMLAFPSISTSDFQFDPNKASDIIIEQVKQFLDKVQNVRLVFVDLTQRSHIFSLVSSKALAENIDRQKFIMIGGDITRLSTEQNLRCNVIANAANWQLKPGGGGVNAAIFRAAGDELEFATRKCAESLSPGSSVVVPLPSTSPLYQKEGVTHVIHVLGPNMNPQRQNCLNNDYDKGCTILRAAYSTLFSNFGSIIQGKIYPESRTSDMFKSSNHRSSFVLKMKRDDIAESEKSKRNRGDYHGGQSPNGSESISNVNNLSIDIKGNKAWGSWAQALHKIAMHPEQHKSNILEETNDYIVLNDLYPKAKRHILILSRLYGLDALSDVRREHLPLMKKMHSAGYQWAESFLKDDSSLVFRLGFHSIPSMRQLHLHVISQDFDSPHLKNKKHWNSFITDFFRDSKVVMEEVDSCGVAIIKDESLLQMELRCHRCRSAHPNIPRLKSHIRKCQASLPGILLQNGRLVASSTTESAAK